MPVTCLEAPESMTHSFYVVPTCGCKCQCLSTSAQVGIVGKVNEVTGDGDYTNHWSRTGGFRCFKLLPLFPLLNLFSS
jgi:hypothetical protein